MPDLSATASFFEAPARVGASTATNALNTPSEISDGVGAVDMASVFANLLLATEQQQPDTLAPDGSQISAGDGPATLLVSAPGSDGGLLGADVHPAKHGIDQTAQHGLDHTIDPSGLQQAIDVAPPSESLAGPATDVVDVDGLVFANDGSVPIQNNDEPDANPLPDDRAPGDQPALVHDQATVGQPGLAHSGTAASSSEDTAAGSSEPATLHTVGKPLASVLNGQPEIGDANELDGENHDDPEIAAGSTPSDGLTSEQSQAPISGPESTPGAAAKAIAWSLAPEQGAQGAQSALGTLGATNGNAANQPEFTPFPPGAANAKGPATPAADPTGAGSDGDAEEASARGNENAASGNRSPVADARSRDQFAQLLNSAFGERPGLPSSSAPGTPENPVFASPAGMASPVVRAAFQPTSGEPPTLPVRAIAVHIAQRFDNGDRRFEIRLDPPTLGRIDVRMDISRDGHVTAQLTADHPETLEALQRDARGLERALQTAGLDTGEDGLSFHLREQQSDEHHASNDGANTDGEDDALDADEASPGRIISLTAVDIRV